MKPVVLIAAVLLLTGCEAVTPGTVPPTTSSTGSTGQVDDTPVLDHRGIGAVRLGMSFGGLQAAGEVGGEAGGPEFSCPVYALKAVRGWVGVEDGIVVDIRVEAGARTPEGLRVGDSRARMREVYPDVEQTPHGFVLELDEEARYQFFFADAGDTLTSIGLTQLNRGCLN